MLANVNMLSGLHELGLIILIGGGLAMAAIVALIAQGSAQNVRARRLRERQQPPSADDRSSRLGM